MAHVLSKKSYTAKKNANMLLGLFVTPSCRMPWVDTTQGIQFVVSTNHPGVESPTISHVPHLAPEKVRCKKHETSTWVKKIM